MPRSLRTAAALAAAVNLGTYAVAQAPCPTRDRNVGGWARNSTVYYDVKELDAKGVADQAREAFKRWQTANGTNASGVKFSPSDARHAPTFTVHIGPAPKQDPTEPDKPAGIKTTPVPNNPFLRNARADVWIDLENPAFFDSGQEEYKQVVLKTMLHEIGHSMGLTDAPKDRSGSSPCLGQTNGISVMNNQCDINDKANNMATDVKDCDNTVVREYYKDGGPSEDGGGGPGDPGDPGDGGPGPCDPFVPDADLCTAICNGEISYDHPDGCGNSWGDWCLTLFPGVFPDGEVVCEVTSRILTLNGTAFLAPAISGSLSLQTYNGYFLSAQNGGGGALTATATGVGSWETFAFEDLNGAPLRDGDPVAFRTTAGAYLQALYGGGSVMTAQGGAPLSWETFTIVSLTAPGQIVVSSDTIGLRSASGHYVVAEGAGGGDVNANRTGIGPWEQFRVAMSSATAPLPAPPPPPPSGGGGGPDTLMPNAVLYPEQSLLSSDGRFRFKYQSDGNLVLYDQNGTPLWHSHTYGTSAGIVTMQGDGNFVVYDGGGTPVWASMVTWGHPGAFLKVQSDGNVVIYDTDGTPLWCTWWYPS